ncbi:hypothetical protein BDZ89DRAFT_1128410 [Hymenopellis radicata]|nr:hypothetical protein BDZ89DRAFT_1128410 [Hymenopellis radicata]
MPAAFGSATYDPWNRMILLGPGLGYGDRQFQQPYDLVERHFVYFHPINRTMRPIPATSLLGGIKTFRKSSRPHPTPPPQVLIAAWSVPKENVPSTPEIWQYFVPPTEELRCLGVRVSLAKLGVEFVTFVVIGGRAVLLGYDQPKRADARLDICVELEDLEKIAALELAVESPQTHLFYDHNNRLSLTPIALRNLPRIQTFCSASSVSSRKRKDFYTSSSESSRKVAVNELTTQVNGLTLSPNTITKVNGFTIHRLKGPDLPQFHDWVRLVFDDEGGQIVMYGGTDHKPSNATNQFRIFDVARMSWQAPTITGYNKASPLPILVVPAGTIFKTSTGQRFLLLFGGVESPSGKTSSKLVSVDLDSMKWCYENVKGGKPCQSERINGCNQKSTFYLRRKGQDRRKATLRRSYSIAEHDDDIEGHTMQRSLRYMTGQDSVRAWSATIGKGRGPFFLSVLLCVRRNHISQTINFNADRWFVFHTRHRTFSALCPLRGALPDEANWYWMQPVTATTEHSRSDDALIVAWVPYGTGDLVPDIWRCNTDDETISCMNIRSRVWDLDLDLHCFVACKGHFFLLGHDNVIYTEDGTQATNEAGEAATTLIDDALYNVVVEIDVDKFNSELKVLSI